MKYSKFLFISLIVFPIAACSTSAEQDTSATATLDYKNNIIIKPIDEYLMSDYSANLYNKVIDNLYSACLAQSNVSYTPTDNSLSSGSREYGFWNPSYLESHGFQAFEDANSVVPLSETEQAKITECYENEPEIKNLHERSLEYTRKTEIAEQILTEARGYAVKDPLWKQARQDWHTCLTNKGLTPRTGEEEWGSKQLKEVDTSTEAGKNEKVRIALLEAQCSQETGMAQKLADLEASYQLPLIRKNQSALNQSKTAVQEFNTQMEELNYNNQ